MKTPLPLKGTQRSVLLYLRQLGRHANTQEIMEGCKLDSRQVAVAARYLVERGLLTKRSTRAMLNGPYGMMRQGKLNVYELTEAGKNLALQQGETP